MEATGRYSYDFMFEYQGQCILLEYDGKQHFHFVPFFHKTYETFLERQGTDIFKTIQATKNGFKIIRIDYTQEDMISEHMEIALKNNQQMYFSTPEMYQYIISSI